MRSTSPVRAASSRECRKARQQSSATRSIARRSLSACAPPFKRRSCKTEAGLNNYRLGCDSEQPYIQSGRVTRWGPRYLSVRGYHEDLYRDLLLSELPCFANGGDVDIDRVPFDLSSGVDDCVLAGVN